MRSLLKDQGQSFDEICNSFEWDIPEFFNMAEAVCDRHSDRPDAIALYYENDTGETSRYTFGAIQRDSNRLARWSETMGRDL